MPCIANPAANWSGVLAAFIRSIQDRRSSQDRSEAGQWARRIHSLWFLQLSQGLNDELRRRKLPALSNPARRKER
jgi:hypothetical protein